MQTVSSIYLEGMGEMVRRPSRMRLTFHYPTGDIIYTNRDIVKVTEKKTAHLIAGELPAVELEMELMNLDGSFNPNDISGLHDLIVKGVPVTYEFGYDIPNLQYFLQYSCCLQYYWLVFVNVQWHKSNNLLFHRQGLVFFHPIVG